MTDLIPQELIQKKRDGLALSAHEIQSFIAGVTSGDVSDAQIAAMAMAICFRDLDLDERTALTLSMRDSGRVLRWKDLGGPVLDKHSTGGVGDLVSLVLGPLMAACGAYIPMISGRGLGHTGGTLDKLDSIPGFDTAISVSKFQSLVRDVGVAIIGQTGDLAPADRRVYAVRDVTATVSSIPLIVASILSKKLAEGLDGLVMDVKVGSGAFMTHVDDARELARSLVLVARGAGLPCNALITDMEYPLAFSAGNSLEVKEAIDYLTGVQRHSRLDLTVRSVCSEMLMVGGLAEDESEAARSISRHLDSGSAAECFARMVSSQGGPPDLIDRPAHYLGEAPFVRPVYPEESGFVVAADTQAVGLAVVDLGGGRRRAEDRIDPAVGLSGLFQPGQQVGPEHPLAIVHANDERDWQRAAARIKSAVRLSRSKPEITMAAIERIK